ncbi:hypothetical protein ACHAW6_015974 [Cyclotella cf. meneghiniana]
MMSDQYLLGGNHHHSSTGPGATVLHAMGQIDTQISHANPTADFLDSPLFAPPSSQQLSNESTSTTLINATNATVAITTTSAPNIPGLGKITPSKNPNPSGNKPKRKVIVVPTYSVNGGLDTKFNSSPRYARPSHLHNLLSPEEYTSTIEVLNDNIKRYRNGTIDKACLAAGPLMLPLAVWGIRHNAKVKKTRGEIERSVDDFNDRMEREGRNVRMFWNRCRAGAGGESYLSIEEVDPASFGDGKYHKVD